MSIQKDFEKLNYGPLSKMEEQPVPDPMREASSVEIKVKVPKRVLHFSDGTLEEFSDDDQVDAQPKQETAVDPRSLTWGPWFMYKTMTAGSTTLSALDYMGELLASFFGITTPKYQYELEEHQRLEAQKKEEAKHAEGWSEPSGAVELRTLTTDQPTSASLN